MHCVKYYPKEPDKNFPEVNPSNSYITDVGVLATKALAFAFTAFYSIICHGIKSSDSTKHCSVQTLRTIQVHSLRLHRPVTHLFNCMSECLSETTSEQMISLAIILK